jgi:hypothetical protein
MFVGGVVVPGPGVAEPECRYQVEIRRFVTLVVRIDVHVDLLRPGLGVVHLDIPMATVCHRATVEQVERRFQTAAACVLFDELLVGKGLLGYL